MRTRLQLSVIKSMYFLSYAAFASWLSFFYVYLKQVNGFSGAEVGIIAAKQQLNMLFVLPRWGLFADKFGRKPMLMLALSATIVMFGGFYLSGNFWYYIVFMILFTAFYNPLNSLLDSINLDYIALHPKHSYGEIRLWASIGWASGTSITGLFINADNVWLIFIISSGLLLVSLLITKFLYLPLNSTKAIASLKLDSIKELIVSDKRLTLFLAVLFFYGIFSSPTNVFINVYYNEIGGTYNHIGYAFAVQALSELPFFFFGAGIVNRFGAKRVFLFTVLVTSVRMFAYSQTNNPWLAIAIGASHGIGLGLFLVSVVAYLHRFIPDKLRSTGQSFVFAFYFGAGMSAGNLFSGWLDNLIRMQHTMLVQSLLSLLLFAFAAIYLDAQQTETETETN